MAVVSRAKGTAARNYPPLAVAGLAMLLMLAIFPSALNLPQSAPAETLEYAPVPPEDQQDVTPPAGNFSSLGLGRSGSLDGSANDGEPPGGGTGATGGRVIKTPSTKRCVGNPPRQSENPLSPPCVASFDGDNGGQTYPGVTGEEVRVLFALPGGYGFGPTSRGSETTPVGIFDLALPPEGEEDFYRRFLRGWQRYFNERFQTYGRLVHFYAHFAPGGGPEERRAQAVEAFKTVRPFAVIASFNVAGGTVPYLEVMHRRGAVAFGNNRWRPAESIAEHAPLAWNHLPSSEEQAVQFSAFLCEKVASHPVSFSGNAGENGRPRVYGLIWTEAPKFPGIRQYRDAVVERVAQCGIRFTEQAKGTCQGCVGPGQGYGTEPMARFQDAGVTTIIWAGGWDGVFTTAAGQIGYLPEWIITGDSGDWESASGAAFQDQIVFDHAWLVGPAVKVGANGISGPCRDAYAEARPEAPGEDVDRACKLYDGIHQLFTGIQVSGPRLTPQAVDKGFHAIPPGPSGDPRVPACFYRPGDYTCVKDSTAMWWDAEARTETGGVGCWRMPEGGRRYLPGEWPDGNVDAQRDLSRDQCNGAEVGSPSD